MTSVAAARGSASVTIPVGTTPGRSGFGPALALTYSSEGGNGPYGFGWSLDAPSITRRVEGCLPRYRDPATGGGEPGDIFKFDGGEDLVAGGETRSSDGVHQIVRYRPRIDRAFSRIERWTRRRDGDVHWRVTDRTNVLTVFGANAESRIADPDDARRVFAWLACERRDDKGGLTLYRYKSDDGRDAAGGFVNRYIKRILYGNQASTLDPDRRGPDAFFFEVVFDYGEHDLETPRPDEDRPWPLRPDPFSNRRSGFEVRTARLCRRILTFHHFPDEPSVGPRGLVSSTTLIHASEVATAERPFSTVAAIRRQGHAQTPAGPVAQALPDLEFDYARPAFGDRAIDVDGESLRNLPAGVTDGADIFVDLDGDGIPGVLHIEPGALSYKRGLGGGRFAPVETLPTRPATKTPGHGGVRLLSLEADGRLEIAEFSGSSPGFHARTEDGGWAPFMPFERVPLVDWTSPHTLLLDLDGDGASDILIAGDDVMVWHPSLGRAGFGPASTTAPGVDDDGPRLITSDTTVAVFVADMTGDGLADLVRVGSSDVSYWPNLGFGRFGRRIAMADAPVFDAPDLFSPARIRMVDIDGSGPTDIVYLGARETTTHSNLGGRRFAPPRRLPALTPFPGLVAVTTADVMGDGTNCLVWSAAGPNGEARSMRYLPLCRGKPHLMTAVRNNRGAETRFRYASSTAFSLADRARGEAWATRLPFPVTVVDRVETIDRIGGDRLTTRYAYHHGLYDEVEREFRGFGFVEQWDAETLDASTESPVNRPPALVRTWFHTGAWKGRERISRAYEGAYHASSSGPALRLPDTVLPAGLTSDEERQACRALMGAMLRQEIYARDGGPDDARPYAVSERNYTLTLVHRTSANGPHAVFALHDREQLDAQLERRDGDARIAHAATLAVDDYGTPLEQIAIAYGRRPDRLDPLPGEDGCERQSRSLGLLTRNRVTNPVLEENAYRPPATWATDVFELLGLPPCPEAPLGFEELKRLAEGGDVEIRSRARIQFRRDDFDGLLPPGQQGALGLPGETRRLAFTDRHLAELAEIPDLADALAAEGGYVQAEDGWWATDGRTFYAPVAGGADPTPAKEAEHARKHFFLPCAIRDPFGAMSHVRYDRYSLVAIETEDALGGRVTAGERDADGALSRSGFDYRVLQPSRMMDANRNVSIVAFDALGRVVATAVRGKPEQTDGDSLDGLALCLESDEIAHAAAEPVANGDGLLADATTRIVYDDFAYVRSADATAPMPPATVTYARETHVSDLPDGGRSRIQIALAYADGLGREIQTKLYSGSSEDGSGERWLTSGWTVHDNKGAAVRTYEPFYDDRPNYRPDRKIGVSTVTVYDPLGRAIASLRPDGSYGKTVFNPWRQETWASDDTALDRPDRDVDLGQVLARYPEAAQPTWRERRIAGAYGDEAKAVASAADVHARTPSRVYLDALGRPILTMAHNRWRRGERTSEEYVAARAILDIEGRPVELRDGLDRAILRTRYDLLGRVIAEHDMDAGRRLAVSDASGAPLRTRDAMGRRGRFVYDRLRRPVAHIVRGADPMRPKAEIMVGRTLFGDEAPLSETERARRNLRGRVMVACDGAGVVSTEAYDWRGQPLATERRLTRGWRDAPDWADEPELDDETFATASRIDALGRPIQVIAPWSSRRPGVEALQPGYDALGRLAHVDLWSDLAERPSGLLDPTTATERVVVDIARDARGQRLAVRLGNGAETTYAYDAETFALTRLATSRPGGSGPVQDLTYIRDAAGRVARIADGAQQALYFRNRVVEAERAFVYDALSQLIEAAGREHLGQTIPQHRDGAPEDAAHPADATAMARYRQHYDYDAAGNIREVRHVRDDGASPTGWRRAYAYDAPSALEPERSGNRLTATTVGEDTGRYAYDAHGSMAAMPHLARMEWDWADRLRATARSAGGDVTWYVYDAAGARVRKVTERAADAGAGARRRERIYLGGFEIERRYARDGETAEFERRTLHVMDDQTCVALVETRTAGEDAYPRRVVRYQLGDHLGSSTVELDGAGRLLSYEEYAPYGATTFQARDARLTSPKRYRFTGKERDGESGLAYHSARYYAPWLGRWTSADPAGPVDGGNLYTYCRGDPVSRVDPDGMDSITIPEVTVYGTVPQGPVAPHSQMTRSDFNAFAQSRGLSAEQRDQLEGYMLDHGTIDVVENPAPYSGPSVGTGSGPNPGDVVVEVDGHKTSFTAEQWDNANTVAWFADSELREDAKVYTYEAEDGDPDDSREAKAAAASAWREYKYDQDREKIQSIVSKYNNVPANVQNPTISLVPNSSSVPAPAPITGNAQRTGTPGHDTRALEIAEEFSNVEGVSAVYLDRAYSTVTSGRNPSRRRADVSVMFSHGSLHVLEVPSKSDFLFGRTTSPSRTDRALVNRNLKALLRSSGGGGGSLTVVDGNKREINNFVQRIVRRNLVD